MQKSIIKDIKEITSEGKKTFYEVMLEDGAKVTTFDAKIKQAEEGDLLEFDVVISGKYINLKDGWKLTKQTSSSGISPGNGHPEMSKEEWAEKNRIERESIEAQVAVKSILQLATAGITDERLDTSIRKALDWCDSRIDIHMKKPVVKQTKTEAKPKEKAEKTEEKQEEKPQIEPTNEPLKNAGELFTRCKNYSITKDQALAYIGVTTVSEIIDLDEAWQIIYKDHFEEGKS